MGFLSLLPSAISLIQGFDANRRANRDAANAQAEQQAALARQNQIAKAVMEKYSRDVSSGNYDPTRRLNDLKSYLSDVETRNINNASGLARSMGYAPGDSESVVGTDRIRSKYALDFNNQANNIIDSMQTRQQQDYLNASQLAMNANNASAGIAQNGYNNAINNRVNLAPALAPLQDYLAGQNKRPAQTQATPFQGYQMAPTPAVGGSMYQTVNPVPGFTFNQGFPKFK